MEFHPAIETLLAMPDRKIVVVCMEIRDQLNLKSRRLSVAELREAYEKVAEPAEDQAECEDQADSEDFGEL